MNIKEFNPFEDVLVCPECGNDSFTSEDITSLYPSGENRAGRWEGSCDRCKTRFLAEGYADWDKDPLDLRNKRKEGVKVNSNDNSWGILFYEGKEPGWIWRRGGYQPTNRKACRANREIQERWVAHLVAEKMKDSQ